jgi:hypothetical protein
MRERPLCDQLFRQQVIVVVQRKAHIEPQEVAQATEQFFFLRLRGLRDLLFVNSYSIKGIAVGRKTSDCS